MIGSKPLMMAVFCLYLWTSNFVFDVIVIIWNRPLKIKKKKLLVIQKVQGEPNEKILFVTSWIINDDIEEV